MSESSELDYKHYDESDDDTEMTASDNEVFNADIEMYPDQSDSGTIWESVQCSGRRLDGTRCSRTTKKYADKCWQHWRVWEQPGLAIRPSTLGLRAGNGLFALSDYKEGDIICEYGGILMPLSEYKQTDSVYGVQIYGTDEVRDASSTQSGLGRWINTCRVGNACENNTSIEYRSADKSVFMKATNDIMKGDEFFTDYGSSFDE